VGRRGLSFPLGRPRPGAGGRLGMLPSPLARRLLLPLSRRDALGDATPPARGGVRFPPAAGATRSHVLIVPT